MSEKYNGDDFKDERQGLVHASGPKDHYKLVYFIMLLLGTGVLFPYNAFISAPDYFSSLYGKNFMLFVAICYSIPNLLAVLFQMKFGGRFNIVGKGVVCLIICLIVLLVVPIMNFTQVQGSAGFAITLILVITMAAFSSILQGTVFGLAGVLPPVYMQAIMSGNGVAGITVSVIRVITKFTLPNTLDGLILGSSIYFFIAAAVVIVCIAGFIMLIRNPYMIYHREKASQRELLSVNDDDALHSLNEGATPPVSIIGVFKKIWKLALSVFFVFFVSLSVFPGIVVRIEAIPNVAALEDGWMPVLIIATFNLFDVIGRTLPRWLVLLSAHYIWIPIIARIVFIPLFVFCISPLLFAHFTLPFIIMAAMALSNGYLSSLCMMYGPSDVLPHEKETAGTMMTFFLLLGITFGTNFTLLLSLMIFGSI